MSHGWSERDKAALKAAIDRARGRAEEEVLREYRAIPVRRVEDLWPLEHKVRSWRVMFEGRFRINYATLESDVIDWLRRGWMKLSDLQSLSPDRLDRMRRMIG